MNKIGTSYALTHNTKYVFDKYYLSRYVLVIIVIVLISIEFYFFLVNINYYHNLKYFQYG